MDVGCAVFNVDTAASLYRAAVTGLPLIKRIVTVSGPAVKVSKNALTRIGTPMQYMFETAGGFVMPPEKIIMGGPMMGVAQHTLEAPVIKQTSGLLAYGKNYATYVEDAECIRCGRCLRGCPMRLMPNYIGMYTKKGDVRRNGKTECARLYGVRLLLVLMSRAHSPGTAHAHGEI